jgi:hypothetical protein
MELNGVNKVGSYMLSGLNSNFESGWVTSSPLARVHEGLDSSKASKGTAHELVAGVGVVQSVGNMSSGPGGGEMGLGV